MASGRRSFGNVRCERIYPIQQTQKTISDLKTVAFQLTSDQAIDLAKKLLGAAQSSKTIDITGFRSRNLISVTIPPVK